MRKINVFIIIFLAMFFIARAEVKLPHIFGDNMVIQRDKTVKIWGWADKGEKVSVSFLQQTKSTKADKAGNWSVTLQATAYGGPYTLKVSGKKNEIVLNNVLVGDVWLCSGQSNMEMPVNGWGKVYDFEKEIANANYPEIRHFLVEKNISDKPLDDMNGVWKVCSPQTVSEFTATGYFFARKLYQELGIPIGILHSSWGGTGIETWTSAGTFDQLPQLFRDQYKDKDIKGDFETFKKENNNSPNAYYSLLYNAMINPVIQFSIKGAIWYQGEHNAGQAYNYRTLFPTLIKDWRAKWGDDFPFYWVQLANYMAKDNEPAESGWAALREAQTMTLSLPNTGQAVITDIGDGADIHPRNKQDVGLRLALIALNKTYGKKSVVYSGPTFKSMEIKGNDAVITFDNIAKGLVCTNKYGYVEGFAIAGADNKFHWAKAYIEGNKVVVSSDKVAKPVAVRYQWSNNPDVNLFNSEGLPAGAFKTDEH
ncbi:MAG: sialate O-acetylesterase [Dysgonamonadaceae bacterium]|jgi:sialate O-acetylesterase|nr:sialate O-acetylesterase [Dysgonamonadaceae bacterium]